MANETMERATRCPSGAPSWLSANALAGGAASVPDSLVRADGSVWVPSLGWCWLPRQSYTRFARDVRLVHVPDRWAVELGWRWRVVPWLYRNPERFCERCGYTWPCPWAQWANAALHRAHGLSVAEVIDGA